MFLTKSSRGVAEPPYPSSNLIFLLYKVFFNQNQEKTDQLDVDIWIMDYGRFPKNLVENGKKGGNYKL